MKSEITTEALRATPAASTIALTFAGVSVEQWASVAAIAFIALQAYFLIRDKAYRPWKEKRDRGQ